MTVHELMSLWARETFSDRNSGVERRIYSMCLERLLDEVQLQKWCRVEDPLAVPRGFENLLVDWGREIMAAHNTDVERGVYIHCSEQLRRVTENVA